MSSYLWMVTINTGDGDRCPREIVRDDVIAALRPILAAAAASGQREALPIPGVSLQMQVRGSHMLADIRAGDIPLVSMGVATRSLRAAKLWQALHDRAATNATHSGDVPAAPWCAVVVHPTFIARPDAMVWAADLEQCIAWTWMEMHGGA